MGSEAPAEEEVVPTPETAPEPATEPDTEPENTEAAPQAEALKAVDESSVQE